MNDYIEITIQFKSQPEMEMLVALLSDIGFEAFEEQEKQLKAFIPEADFNEMQLEHIAGEKDLIYSKSLIKQKNWNEIWEQSFQPVILEDFCAIRAAFHSPISGITHEIIITPKMSFGTGHHATTFMMMEAMKNIDVSGKSVLDFGTGTAVLAILAEKMGASSIDAIDNDDWSIINAAENLQINNCKNVNLYKSNVLPFKKNFNIILANINKNAILQQLPAMYNGLFPGGVILLSGLLSDDLNEMQKSLVDHRFNVSGMKERNNWVCLQGGHDPD